MALSSPPVVVDQVVDRERLLDKLSPTSGLVLLQIHKPKQSCSARLARADAELAMQRDAPLEVRAPTLDGAAESIRQAQSKTGPALERLLSQLAAELARLGQRLGCRQAIPNLRPQQPSRYLDLGPVAVTIRTTFE